MKRLLTIALALIVLAPGPAFAAPNILLQISDDQADITQPFQASTNARYHVDFPNAFDTTPLCCPSRATIFSGKYAHNHGIFVNDGTGFDAQQSILCELHDAGYRVAIFGKFLNDVPSGDAPCTDVTFNTNVGDDDGTAAMTGQIEDFLAEADQNDSQPWLIVDAPWAPHKPWNEVPAVPEPIPPLPNPGSWNETDFSDKDVSVRAVACGPQSVPKTTGLNCTRPLRVQSGDALTAWTGQMTELQALDEHVRDVWNSIHDHGESTSTLAFYTSDNGWLFAEHNLAGKEWPYSVPTPLLMRWNGHTAPGTDDTRIAENVDIAPTIYAATGITPSYPVDGHSLLAPDPPRTHSFFESDHEDDIPGPGRWVAYRTPERFYIRWDDGWIEDYDLTTDPEMLAASNVPDPAIDTILLADSLCVGPTCP